MTPSWPSPAAPGSAGQPARGPRLHDFRHTFAVNRLLEWYRDGGDVQARLPLLTDYLSHVSLVSTQLYLDMDPPTVFAFLEDLEATRGNGIQTRNARLAAIHSFFHYVAAEEPAAAALCRAILGIPFKRETQSSIASLAREEIGYLLGAPDCSRPEGRRDAALLWFLYNTGARAQEVVDTRLSAVRFDAPAQVRLHGKGRKERLCPLWSETVQRLRHMLRDRQADQNADQPLFLNAAGRPLTRFGLRFIVRRWRRFCGRIPPGARPQAH